jgi:hypothetical protein
MFAVKCGPNAPVKVNPDHPPPPTPDKERTWWGFSGFLSSNYVPTMSGICWFCHSAELRREDHMGIVRGLSAAILYYFVPFCPMESPGSTILYHVTKVKMACSCEIERNFINILLI